MSLSNAESLSAAYAAGFWEAAERGVLAIQHCETCGEDQLYPRRRCVTCGAADLTYRPVSGLGSLYSFSTVLANAPSDFIDEMPYTLAIVELDEGPRLLTRIDSDDPAALRCDMPVQCVFRERDGATLPYFVPAAGTDGGPA
ncbi:MAG: hypothetical protein JWQ18_596 [Conexibacter sp.]|nr:hypothetical protein [Conexibacter sp.]